MNIPVRAHSGRIVAVEKAPAVSSMSRADYDALPGLVNFSTLKLMGKSPAHYRERIQNPPGPDSDAMRLGRATHLAVLEPAKFEAECVRWDGGRRSGGKWEEFAAAHASREILTPPEWEQCLAMRAAVRGSDMASRYLLTGAAEQTILWEHVQSAVADFPEVRTACKSRVDWLAPSATVDFKTTRDASPEGVERGFWNLGYHVQAAFYADAREAATGERVPFIVVAVESSAPHVVQVYEVSEDPLAIGRETYQGWLARRAACLRDSRWPGYAEAPMMLTAPRWARASDGEDISDLDLAWHGDAHGL